MLLNHELSQLVLVDYQAKLMPAIHDHESVLKNARILAQMAKKCHVPVFATEHMPEKIGEFDPTLAALCKGRLRKSHFSACPEGLVDLLMAKPQASGNARSLPKHLQKPAAPSQPERGTIVVAGCEAHVCLLQTALELIEQEFDVWVVTDACTSRTERNRDAAFDRLAGAGAELVTTEMVAFEWLRTADDPRFKDVHGLIK